MGLAWAMAGLALQAKPETGGFLCLSDVRPCHCAGLAGLTALVPRVARMIGQKRWSAVPGSATLPMTVKLSFCRTATSLTTLPHVLIWLAMNNAPPPVSVCSLPPGTAVLMWRQDRIVSVRLTRRRLQGSNDTLACHALLSALDRGAAKAGLRYELEGLSVFQRRVLKLCARIRPGSVRTYGWLATTLGCPNSARAVGQALAANPVPLLVPCHRVVGAGGLLGGFTGGLAWKEFLLGREGWSFAGTGRRRRLAAACPERAI